MADVDGEQNGLDDQQEKKAKKKMFNSGAADLEKVTDFEEEQSISKDISSAVNLFSDKRQREDEEKLKIETELQKVSITKEDVELIMNEMEISRALAEKTLREHRGNIVAALETLIK